MFDFIATFFFRFLKRNIFFFFIDFQNQIDFSTFFRFLKLVVALDFHYNVIAQQDSQTFHKKKSNRIVIAICERIYRGFVLICKKFDIKKCWSLAHFRKLLWGPLPLKYMNKWNDRKEGVTWLTELTKKSNWSLLFQFETASAI